MSPIKQTHPLTLCTCRIIQMLWVWFFILIIILHFIPISIMSSPVKCMWSSTVTTLGHLMHTQASTLLSIQVGYPGMHIHCTHTPCR